MNGGGGHDAASASLVPLSEFEARWLTSKITEARSRWRGIDLQKATERIEWLVADDRYPRHADQMRMLLRGHLVYATDTGSRLFAVMGEYPIPSEAGGASC